VMSARTVSSARVLPLAWDGLDDGTPAFDGRPVAREARGRGVPAPSPVLVCVLVRRHSGFPDRSHFRHGARPVLTHLILDRLHGSARITQGFSPTLE
jgi:hypothetical protein